MLRTGIAVALAALVVTNPLSAADSPEVQNLKQQVKALREQRDAAAKVLHAQYDALINGTKLTEAQLATARNNLAAQQQQLGASDNSSQSKTMQSNMETLKQALNGNVKLTSDQINALRAQRSTHINLVTAAYNAKIKEVEAAIKVAAAAKTSSTAQKPKTK